LLLGALLSGFLFLPEGGFILVPETSPAHENKGWRTGFKIYIKTVYMAEKKLRDEIKRDIRKEVKKDVREELQGKRKKANSRIRNVKDSKTRKMVMAYKVPHCVEHYLPAMVNPFDTVAGACIPCDLFPLPSRKIKVFCRTTMTLGTSGVGYTCWKPTGANDAWGVTCTSASSVGTKTAALSTFTNTVTTNISMIPYNTAQIVSSNVAHRLVSGGIRIKYIGKLADRNGMCLSYEDPDSVSCDGQTWDYLGSNPYTTSHRVLEQDWDAAVCYSGPTEPSDLEFTNDSAYPRGNKSMFVIMASGVAGDEYSVECYQHLEYIGSAVVGKNKSHADPAAYAKVAEIVKGATEDRSLEPSMLSKIWNGFKDAMSDTLPGLIQIGGGLLSENPGLIAGGATSIFGSIGKFITGDSSKQYHGSYSRQIAGKEPTFANFSPSQREQVANHSRNQEAWMRRQGII